MNRGKSAGETAIVSGGAGGMGRPVAALISEGGAPDESERTEVVFIEGFYRSGDLDAIDWDGYLSMVSAGAGGQADPGVRNR